MSTGVMRDIRGPSRAFVAPAGLLLLERLRDAMCNLRGYEVKP